MAHPPWRHLLLALAVVAVWGTNFVVIKVALAHLPPLLFAALRFALAFFPAVLLLPRPPVPWRNLAAYGLLIGVGNFGVLYLAMKGNISPGLASLVIQTQVFFTIVLAMRVARERVQGFQWVALVLGAAGIGVIALHTGGDTTVLGLAMVLGAAFCWASGNIVAKQAGQVNMLAYVVWSSAAAVPPLVLMSLVFEGWPAIEAGLVQADAATWAAVLWQSLGNTLFGYAAWGWLLARHPAASISPMALLVPVFGMASSGWWLGEALPAWKLGAASLILCGLALNVLWPRWRTAQK
ncbi:EamA family transporter [Piscinibacter sp. HJYY11]|uniref:EamA family transporter n=1 Tax=Piscinibacter sp. HJYY11 TaxID=2801333 RepID=UPI00191C9DA8|nr:EamA family transporter [Piscinibacter sp. HJYY11]MBL0729537.1 EamA family transporter [Piscinibacter sp. HJYY11]